MKRVYYRELEGIRVGGVRRPWAATYILFHFYKIRRKEEKRMTKLLGKSKMFLNRNASTILTCIGGAGVVATSVLAVKATPKALRLLEEAKKKKGEELTVVDTIKTAGPAYIPAIIVGASTIACIFGANAFNKRQQASLMSAYALVDSSYKEYRKKVNELYGEDADENVNREIAKDKYNESDISKEDDKQLFYDMFSRRYFNSTIEDVQRAEYKVNRRITKDGWALLNDFYLELGVDAMPSGEEFGWSEGGNRMRYWEMWVDFHHEKVVMDDGLECYIIHMMQEPYLDWNDY